MKYSARSLRLIAAVITIPFLHIHSQVNFSILHSRPGSPGDVAIQTIAKKGNYLYVASRYNDCHLKTYDISNPATLVLTDSLAYPSSGDKEIRHFIIDGNYLYAAGFKGLMVFDLVNPAHPALVAHIKTVIGGSTTYTLDSYTLAKSGSLLLVEAGWLGTVALDVSNPSSPAFMDLITYSGTLLDVCFVNSNTAVLVDGFNTYYVDCSNPSNITKHTVYSYGDPENLLFDAASNILYIGVWTTSKTWLYSVNPSTKAVLDSLDITPVTNLLGDMSLKNADTLVMGNNNSNDLVVFDVSNPSGMTLAGVYSNNQLTGAKEALLCSGDLIYAANYDDLVIYKWSSPAATELPDRKPGPLLLYPNPTTGLVTYSVEEKTEVITVLNAQGDVVLRQPCYDSGIVDISGQPEGIYFLLLTGKSENIRCARVIKQN